MLIVKFVPDEMVDESRLTYEKNNAEESAVALLYGRDIWILRIILLKDSFQQVSDTLEIA